MFSPSGIRTVTVPYPIESKEHQNISRNRLEKEYDELLKKKREEESKDE